MEPIVFYQIDAFSNGPFTGNPAAVVPLNKWLDDGLMQQIAMEHNLSETAFIVADEDDYQIRWFTPQIEVDLCGHATLASAFVVFNYLRTEKNSIVFHSKSGPLYVKRSDDLLLMDFPTDQIDDCPLHKVLVDAIGIEPVHSFKGKSDVVFVYKNHETIKDLKPNFNLLSSVDIRGLIATAPGFDQFDFVSRGFFPAAGINEDPATGSAHTTLTPYWSKQLNKNQMSALQMSQRGGYFELEDQGERTILKGKAHIFAEGKFFVNQIRSNDIA